MFNFNAKPFVYDGVWMALQTVSVWGSGGRIELSVAKFMAMQAAIRPDCYESMADGETWQTNTSRKRVRKAVERTLSHLDQCLESHHKTQVQYIPAYSRTSQTS